MSAATVTIYARAGELDRLSESVIDSWNRPVSRPLYRGSVWVIFFTAITLGIWPLWKSIRWLRDYAVIREQRGVHLAEWFRFMLDHPSVATLHQRASQLRPSTSLLWLMRFGLLAALGMVVLIGNDRRLHWHTFYDPPKSGKQLIFAALICGVSALLFIQLLAQHRRFKKFLNTLNPLLARFDLNPVKPTGAFHFNLLDWIGGLVLSSHTAVWPLATVVSIGLLRSYIRQNLRVHVQIGERVRLLLARQAPPLRLPPRHDLLNRCANVQCGAILPEDARFCSRCGNVQNEATATHNENWRNEAAVPR